MNKLRTFLLPDLVTGGTFDRVLGRLLVKAWQEDGIFQISATPEQDRKTQEALTVGHRFFSRSVPYKTSFVSDLTYSGYIASGEEVTAEDADNSEMFMVCPDV